MKPPEFTGERLIPGQVNEDLLNEHMARYAFAARLARAKRVLDAGCGAGYGSAELAHEAAFVVGADSADEAIEFAREQYRLPGLCFERASCTALPHPDASFDLVVAFEVIEHLENWRELLLEARRVLAASGQFVVSTPNKLFYAESRGQEGPNPFHVHEFEFEEFRSELLSVFPEVAMYLENHVEGVAFEPFDARMGESVHVTGEAKAEESHFFIAVCAHRPAPRGPTYIYIPRMGNVLRERQRHIGLLEGFLKQAQREHQELLEAHRTQTEELERSNRWAEQLNQELEQRRARVAALQEELALQREGYEGKVRELEEDIRSKVEWARDLQAQIDDAVAAVQSTAKELEERTQEKQRLEQQLASVRDSRWVKLGRMAGVGPELPG